MADAKWSAAIFVYTRCTPYKHAPVYSVTFFEATCKMCLPVTCHLHFWQNDWDLLRATAVTRGWNVYQNKSRHRNTGEENSPTAPAGTWSLNISIMSPALYHWAIPVYHAIHFYPVSSNHFNTHHSEKDTRPVHSNNFSIELWLCHSKNENETKSNINAGKLTQNTDLLTDMLA